LITLYLAGGLGNQLFNYAAARSLADRHNTDLIIDASSFQGAPVDRPCLLDRFAVRGRFRHLNGSDPPSPFLGRLWRRMREDALARRVTRRYEDSGYLEGFERLGSRVILRGHFINRRFFDWNEARILKDLAVDLLPSPGPILTRVLAELAQDGPEAVAIHVRRGDFAAPHASWLLLPGIERYYARAIEAIADEVGSPRPWIFSDDLQWAQRLFAESRWPVRLVDDFLDGATDPLNEFRLMSACPHHIIANSSFSLWAAALGAHPTQRVFAPARWDGEGRVAVDELLPPHWRRVDW
jgi:hypothetical protein